MKLIDAQYENGVFSPSVPLPSTALRVVFNGTHYVVYEEGDTLPQEEVSLALVEQQVTMRQARLALLQAGYLGQIDSFIQGMVGAEGEAARIEWEYGLHVERHSPLVAMMASMLSLSSEEVDNLFKQASLL